jgi:hypothetical protein
VSVGCAGKRTSHQPRSNRRSRRYCRHTESLLADNRPMNKSPSARPPQARLRSASSVRSRGAPSVTIRCSGCGAISLGTEGCAAPRPSALPGPAADLALRAPVGRAPRFIPRPGSHRPAHPPACTDVGGNRQHVMLGHDDRSLPSPLTKRGLERTHGRRQPAWLGPPMPTRHSYGATVSG